MIKFDNNRLFLLQFCYFKKAMSNILSLLSMIYWCLLYAVTCKPILAGGNICIDYMYTYVTLINTFIYIGVSKSYSEDTNAI